MTSIPMKTSCSLHKFTDRFGYYSGQCTCGLRYVDFAAGYSSEDELALISCVNAYRAAQGLPKMLMDPILMLVARERVKVFNHHANGQWVWEAAREQGYKGFCTDNLAKGYETPAEAVGDIQSGWGDRREGHNVGHSDQMLGFFKMNGKFVDYKFDQIGVASYPEKKQYIAIFGTLTPPDFYKYGYGVSTSLPQIKQA